MPPSRPTIADVAQRACVSIATVSRVLNGTAPVDTETAERVRDAIAALNYFPHAAARTLASRRTETIGLLLPEISGAFFQPLLRGVEAGVSEAGFDLLIHSTQSHPENTPHRPLGEHNTDGLLVFTESLDAKELTRLHTIKFPVVLLHQSPPNSLNIPVVTIENQSGAQKIVDHLIETHNCRRIVFLQGPEGHEDSTWREKGYRLALEGHGLAYDPSLVARGAFNRDEAQTTMGQMLLNGVKFDAVFAGDDDSAVGVYLALRFFGRRVPEDVAVAGFDDQVFASTLTPALTTVLAPTERVGREAVHLLARLLKGDQAEPRLILPTELIIRTSCGCRD
jgi:DNA-binding LacI/PurR family transcriptional regulator